MPAAATERGRGLVHADGHEVVQRVEPAAHGWGDRGDQVDEPGDGEDAAGDAPRTPSIAVVVDVLRPVGAAGERGDHRGLRNRVRPGLRHEPLAQRRPRKLHVGVQQPHVQIGARFELDPRQHALRQQHRRQSEATRMAALDAAATTGVRVEAGAEA